MAQIRFSIIIVSYKKIDIVIDCINSIFKHNDIDDRLEVILVDNSPGHNVYEAVMAKFDSVIGIKNENTGFGAGNNLGASRASGEYVLFLNPDTILVEPVLGFAVQKFQENSRLALFGLKLININMTRNMSMYFINGGGILSAIATKLCNAFDIYIDGYMYVSGANMFVRHSDFIESGQFDENIFMYYEEPDLTLRLRQINKSTAYFKEKRIIHLEGGTSSDEKLALSRRIEAAIYYCRKYKFSPEALLTRELRLNYLKRFIYKITLNSKSESVDSTIDLLKENLHKIRKVSAADNI